jgi:hypothetical protein
MRILPFLQHMPLPMFEGEGVNGGGGGDQAAADAAAAAAAAEAAKGGKQSALNPGEEQSSSGPADWPDDWRDKLAGEDKDARKRLDRFKAPGDIFKSYVELETKFKQSGGKPADIPPPDGEKDPDGLKAWREERGIPADPTGYAVPDTIKDKVTEDDKPVVEGFTASMHAKNIPPAAAAAAMEFYFETRDQQLAAELQADRAAATEVGDVLRKEWGVEYTPLSKVASRFAAEITPGIDWFDARLEDGRLLSNIPEVVKALADLGMQKFGDVSYAGTEAAAKTSGRKAELEKIQRDEPEKYTPELRTEYGDIIAALEKRGESTAPSI